MNGRGAPDGEVVRDAVPHERGEGFSDRPALRGEGQGGGERGQRCRESQQRSVHGDNIARRVDRAPDVPQEERALATSGCGPVPPRTNVMKSDSARRDGWTSPPSPKKRVKLMMSGRHRSASMWGRGPLRSSSDSSTCSLTMWTSNAFADTFLPNGRTSCTTPSICTGHSAMRGGRTASEGCGVSCAVPALSGS